MVIVMATGCSSVEWSINDVPRPMVAGHPVEEVAAPSDAHAAIVVILDAYKNLTGIDALAEVPVAVHWTDKMPERVFGATTHTMAYGCDTWLLSGSMFSRPKVLPHELGHCVRWLLTGDGDSAHIDETWWGQGGLVDQAHAAESAAGY